ncbi:hypothetical protein [Amycolatopsis sp. GM8]|uniref:hypothetical protein n=1 Tax=Amycolatopsis sp. GM8 TaxID=2896530 RepID=UPI001F1EA147|nr:hypothetical protein [Amycolatopsis sp. GM8]
MDAVQLGHMIESHDEVSIVDARTPAELAYDRIRHSVDMRLSRLALMPWNRR